MQSVQEIKRRVKSIESTKQITKSMRLVSSAKVQKVQKHIGKISSFYEGINEYLDSILSINQKLDNIYFNNLSDAPMAVVVISSDRGLCGAYNMNVTRSAIELCKEYENPYVIIVGSRMSDAFKREGIKISQTYSGISETPMYEEAQMITYRITQLYLNGDISGVMLVYTSSASILVQEVVTKKILPCDVPNGVKHDKEYMIEPDLNEMINNFMPIYIAGMLQHSMSESALSEQSARITSMDSASKNADELITKLTLEYNQIRQSEITNEINEIVSGAAGVSQ